MTNVVAVTQVGQRRTRQRPGFGDCLQVGEGLTGMLFVREQVDDRGVGVGGHGYQIRVVKNAHGQNVQVPI